MRRTNKFDELTNIANEAPGKGDDENASQHAVPVKGQQENIEVVLSKIRFYFLQAYQESDQNKFSQ